MPISRRGKKYTHKAHVQKITFICMIYSMYKDINMYIIYIYIYIYVYELVLKRWKFCQVIWESNRWLKWAIQPWFPMHIQRKAKQVSTWLSSHRGKNFWVPPNLNLETSMAIQPSIVHLHAFFPSLASQSSPSSSKTIKPLRIKCMLSLYFCMMLSAAFGGDWPRTHAFAIRTMWPM